MLSRAVTLSIIFCFALVFMFSTMMLERNGINALLLRGSDNENSSSTHVVDTPAIPPETAFLRGSELLDDSQVVMSHVTGAECQVISTASNSMVFASECKEADKCLVEVANTKQSKENMAEIVRRINQSAFPGLLKIPQHRIVDEYFNYISIMTVPEGSELVSLGPSIENHSMVGAQVANIINHLNRQGIWTNLLLNDLEAIGHAFVLDTKSERVYLVSLATLSLMED